MSYPIQRPNQASSDAATTSSIHEYTCLFTHDLKRKTKRWQDGRLRHHVFNNRIMVYDDGGASIGDAHLSAANATLEEGDEINLDRGGAIVQICERVGEKEVDLRELVDKRMREVEKRRREAAEKPSRPSAGGVTVQRSQQPQRPLNAIMQTPGRIGRAAIPKDSPYEQRLQREAAAAERQGQGQGETTPLPPAKRRKRSASPPSKMGHARALFGTQLTLSARPVSSWSQRSSAAVLRDRTNVNVGRSQGHGEDVVMLEKPSQSQESEDERNKAAPLKRHLPASSPGHEDDCVEERVAKPAKSAKSATQSRTQGLPRLLSSIRKVPEDGQVDISRSRNKRPPAVVTIDSSNDDATTSKATTAPLVEQTTSSLRNATKRKLKQSRQKVTSREQSPSEDDQAPAERANKPPARALHKKPKSSGVNPPDSRPQKKRATESIEKKDSEPRTELRIRSRKKRGLLMLAEPPSAVETPPVKPAREASPIPEEENAQSFEEWYTKSLALESAGHGLDGSPPPDSPPAVERDTIEVAQTGPSEPALRTTSSPPPTIPEITTKAQTTKADTDSVAVGSSDMQSIGAMPSAISRSINLPESPIPEAIGNPAEVSDDSSSEPPARPSRRRRTREPSPALSDDDPYKLPEGASDESDSDDWDGPPPPQPPARKQPQREKPARPIKAAEKPQVTKPRMSRINKSCKSKEIFGFTVPGSGPVVPGSLASTASIASWGPGSNVIAATAEISNELPKTTSKARASEVESVVAATAETPNEQPKTTSKDQARESESHRVDAATSEESTEQQESNNSKESKDPTTDNAKAKPLRVTNPATRGRKAASKADAAGRAPQIAVPFDSVSTTTTISKVGPVAAVARPEPPKEPTSLPGFSRANGGAWSRHAEDLLGMVRPKRVSGR